MKTRNHGLLIVYGSISVRLILQVPDEIRAVTEHCTSFCLSVSIFLPTSVEHDRRKVTISLGAWLLFKYPKEMHSGVEKHCSVGVRN
jgi:hypothetical protein